MLYNYTCVFVFVQKNTASVKGNLNIKLVFLQQP